MFPIRKLYKIHEISIPEYEKNGVKRWGLYVVRKGTIYTAHIYVHICIYVKYIQQCMRGSRGGKGV